MQNRETDYHKLAYIAVCVILCTYLLLMSTRHVNYGGPYLFLSPH